jgi:hypothetical protein
VPDGEFAEVGAGVCGVACEVEGAAVSVFCNPEPEVHPPHISATRLSLNTVDIFFKATALLGGLIVHQALNNEGIREHLVFKDQ